MSETAVRPTATTRPVERQVHRLDVAHVHGEAYAVDIRGHQLLVDQPTEEGGNDTAPTPTELFAASLATHVAFCAGRYLRSQGMPRSGLRIRTEFTTSADRPPGIASVRLFITPPPGLSAQRHADLLAVASHCTVHNTLHGQPETDVRLEPGTPV
ncbi:MULTISPECIES: OsmC family protein [Streptomyces]|uniref:OsmC family protein n=1 Tax=Streptomyces sp. NBC_00093 TaxID=2975649 RepID=A0AAU2AGG9_9ACTN